VPGGLTRLTGRSRQQGGNPDFSEGLRLVAVVISDEEMLAKSSGFSGEKIESPYSPAEPEQTA
jgi:hypothetical protein